MSEKPAVSQETAGFLRVEHGKVGFFCAICLKLRSRARFLCNVLKKSALVSLWQMYVI